MQTDSEPDEKQRAGIQQAGRASIVQSKSGRVRMCRRSGLASTQLGQNNAVGEKNRENRVIDLVVAWRRSVRRSIAGRRNCCWSVCDEGGRGTRREEVGKSTKVVELRPDRHCTVGTWLTYVPSYEPLLLGDTRVRAVEYWSTEDNCCQIYHI